MRYRRYFSRLFRALGKWAIWYVLAIEDVFDRDMGEAFQVPATVIWAIGTVAMVILPYAFVSCFNGTVAGAIAVGCGAYLAAGLAYRLHASDWGA